MVSTPAPPSTSTSMSVVIPLPPYRFSCRFLPLLLIPVPTLEPFLVPVPIPAPYRFPYRPRTGSHTGPPGSGRPGVPTRRSCRTSGRPVDGCGQLPARPLWTTARTPRRTRRHCHDPPARSALRPPVRSAPAGRRDTLDGRALRCRDHVRPDGPCPEGRQDPDPPA